MLEQGCQTDKSGRMAVDSKQNYIRATEAHTTEDAIIDSSTHERNQKEVNAHSTMWVRIMKAGELTSTNSVKGADRVRNSMKVLNHGYAPLYTLRKDHKNVDDQNIGPPTRPVCGGSAAYNHRFSYFLGMLLRPVWQEKETSCLSTEEMLAAIQSVNESGRLDERCTVGSADVTALYPSIDIEIAATKVSEMFFKSGVEVADVDTRELGLYLALNRTRAQLEEAGIAECCPTRRTNRGRPPNMTGCAQSATELERYKPWKVPANNEPDKEMTKRMLGEALAVAVKFVMKNHIYTFNGKARQQRKGGPIGLGLMGDVAQILMCWWDEELMKRLNEKGMEVMLYKRLVDDINMVLRKREGDDDGQGPMDKRNMDFVQEVANEILQCIKVTTDYPSKNPASKMPILDLRVWMTSLFDPVTHEVNVKVLHEHYSKDVASKAVIDARSAVPWKVKRTVLTQEVIRVLRNCSRNLPWGEVCVHVEEYSRRMQFSGYQESFRGQVVKSALDAYDKMIARDQQGEEPMYRPRNWKRVERAEARRMKKSEWFRGKGGKNESVIFVPATPGSELKKRYLDTIQKAEVEIAVAEVPGSTAKSRVQRSDPFRDRKCEDPDGCMVCGNGGKGGRCRDTGVTYEVRCKRCDERYIGETSRNAYTRGREHMNGIEKKSVDSPFHIHNVEKHGGDGSVADYQMKVTKVFGGDATKRQVSEAVQIQHSQGQLINRQDEWRQVTLPRIQLSL